MRSLSNVKLSDFRKFLEAQGLKLIRTKGGHEVWSRSDLLRPVIIQSHIDPIPEFIIKNNLRTISASINEFAAFLER